MASEQSAAVAGEYDGVVVSGRRPTSMISWIDAVSPPAEVPDDLTWSDVLPLASARPLEADLERFMAAADGGSTVDALRQLADASIARWGCDAVVWCVCDAAPDAERTVLVRTAAGLDDGDATSSLVRASGREFDGAVRARLDAAEVVTADLPAGDALRASLWLVWRELPDAPPAIEPALLRAAGLALRAVRLTERLEERAPRPSVDLVRRDRREAAIGKMLGVAAPAMVAAHATLASTHASLEAELVGLRMVAPLHPVTRACASLIGEAREAARAMGDVAAAVSSLSDEASRTSDPSRVVASIAALLGPYVARRATLEVSCEALPYVRLAPAYLAEAMVMFATRVAFQFAEGGDARVLITGTTSLRGVEIDVCATAPCAASTAHHGHDDVVAEVYGRDLAARCGGVVEVRRDAAGATAFRVVLPRA